MDDSYPYKLRLAKAVYRDVNEVIEKWQGREGLIDILCHWDGCITIDDVLFHERQLMRKDENDE